MTTTALHDSVLPRAGLAGGTGGDAGIPLARLVRVELRKLVDTRAGRWLLAAIALATAAAVVIYLLASDPAELTFQNFVIVTILPQSLILPVLGIMAVTSEWTQRTGLVTHTLEPRRSRVLVAKFAATGILGLLSVALAVGVAAVGTAIGAALVSGNGSWAFGIDDLRDTLLFQLLSLLAGLAMGALLMNTAAAITLYFVLPTVFAVVFSMVDALQRVAGWIDMATSQDPLYRHSIAGDEWLQLGATTLWWIVLPLAAGLWRLLHREIK